MHFDNIFEKGWFYKYMRLPFFITFFLFTSSLLFAQNLSKVDERVKLYPAYTQVTQIAKRINKDYHTDIEKARAVYSWVTKTIKYDIKEFLSGSKQYSFRYSSKEELQRKITNRNNAIVNKTLKTRKAICDGYSKTVKKICDLINLKCVVISGYTKSFTTEIGRLPLGGRHAWNAILIDGKWKLIDTTWGAGYGNEQNRWIQRFDDYFFLTPPEDLINSHFPQKTKWQLLEKTYSQKEFANFPILTPYYFKNRLHLISPKTGTLKFQNEPYFFIKFDKKNISEDFAFAYKNDVYMTSIIPELINNQTVLKIPAKRNTALNIIVANKVALMFQVD